MTPRPFPVRLLDECRRLALAMLLALPVAMAAGCGDDDNPADPGGGGNDTTDVGPGRGTIDSLISVYLPAKYSERDSAGYEAMLDDRYTFEPLSFERAGRREPWDRTEELKIAGRMFKGWTNPDGMSVESITANLIVTNTLASGHPDEPADEEWFDVEAVLDMIVVVSDPSVTDGTGIINFIINSNQGFVVVRDPDHTDDWVVVRQVDKEQINKQATHESAVGPVPGGTEEATWSDVKGLFRGESGAERAGTESSSWGAVKSLFR